MPEAERPNMAKYRLFLAAILDSVWILAILLEKQPTTTLP
jgi:hypothetical protein